MQAYHSPHVFLKHRDGMDAGEMRMGHEDVLQAGPKFIKGILDIRVRMGRIDDGRFAAVDEEVGVRSLR